LQAAAGEAFTTAFGNSLLAAAAVAVVVAVAVFLSGRSEPT
jgi:hypothetical protein